MDGLAAKAEHLRSLHVPGRPLVLPNAWDAASARAVEAAGFLAVATASAAIAESLGYRDGEGTPVDAMFAAVARVVGAVAVPVSADIEAGYVLPPAECRWSLGRPPTPHRSPSRLRRSPVAGRTPTGRPGSRRRERITGRPETGASCGPVVAWSVRGDV
jgi:hypothetical protein